MLHQRHVAYNSSGRRPRAAAASSSTTKQYGWRTDADAQAEAAAKRDADPRVREVPLASIRRPLGRTRANDQAKVEALIESIEESGLLEPIDVLEVEGAIYGFSGCHRFEAHQRMGRETILCRVRRATRETLMMHLR
jgi:sulfiredoxin